MRAIKKLLNEMEYEYGQYSIYCKICEYQKTSSYYYLEYDGEECFKICDECSDKLLKGE